MRERRRTYHALAAEPLPGIALVPDRPPPGLVVEVPADGGVETALEIMSGAPAERRLGARGIHGIAQVMPGPVTHEGDQPLPRARGIRAQPVERGADRPHHLQVA